MFESDRYGKHKKGIKDEKEIKLVDWESNNKLILLLARSMQLFVTWNPLKYSKGHDFW